MISDQRPRWAEATPRDFTILRLIVLGCVLFWVGIGLLIRGAP